MASFDLQEELQTLRQAQDISSYDIPKEQDISSMNAHTVDGVLEAAVEALADSPEAITDPVVFDTFRSFLKYSASLQGSTMNKLFDSVSSAFSAEVDAVFRDEGEQQSYASHRFVLEKFAFLLNWFVAAAEKVKASGEDEDAPPPPTRAKRGRGGKAAAARARRTGSWSWIGHIPTTLELMSRVLDLQTQRIWPTTAERDTFINCLLSPAYRAAESVDYMKAEADRCLFYRVIAKAVKHHGHSLAAQISIMQNLQFFEHLGEPMAELVACMVKEYDHQQLCDEVLREIAGKTYSAVDIKGTRTTSKFLIKLVQIVPRSVLKQISLLLLLLDSEFYPMRVALVEIVGFLIEDITTSHDESDQNTLRTHLNGLFDLLLERTSDLSVYVRSKSLSVLAKLCDLPNKFPKQRLRITTEAVGCLEDNSSLVRKAAINLLNQLVVTHPYFMHESLLQLTQWEAHYDEVVEKLLKMQGEVDKVIEGERESQDGEEDEDDAEGQEQGDGEPAERLPKGKKRLRKRRHGDDAMDVDEEEEDEDDDDNEGEDQGENGEDDDSEPGDVEMADGEARPKKKGRRRKSEINMEGLNDAAVVQALQSEELTQLKLKKRYYADGLSFIRQIEAGMKLVENLLCSKSKPEVLEAMDFFRVVHKFQFEGADAGVKRMVHLIWVKDDSATSEDGEKLKGIRPRLLECYQDIYFEPLPELQPKQQVNRIAKNMIELTYDATLAELTSLEEMMRILMDQGQIHDDVIAKLWQVYRSDRQIPNYQRSGAVMILGMLALARRNVVAEHVDTLIKIGLGRYGRADLLLARYTYIALQRLNGSAKKVKGSLLDQTMRLSLDNGLWSKLQDSIEYPCRSKEWFGVAEQAINTIYALAERPDLVCEKLVKDFTRRVFGRKDKRSASRPPADVGPMDQDGEAGAPASAAAGSQKSDVEDKDVGDAFELAQLLFVVGHVAIKQIVFLEQVEREWKRLKAEREEAEKAASGREKGTKDGGDELEQVAGNAEDDIGERVHAMRDTELLQGDNSLLKTFGPMLMHICGSRNTFKDPTLRAAAVLSYGKFLCISSAFCEKGLDLFIRLLEASKDEAIRSNIVIALGDVAISFNSLIDENSDVLYQGLSDKSTVVKKNALMVLSHLILKNMIKVKGQLGEMAKCLEDKDEKIADLAKLFFSSLSTKDNAVYNNLSDIISHLSASEKQVDEETFQRTMTYIFSFIEKDRQAENIVEKLCQRFRLVEDPRQWRDIAFCLSLLPFKSDRSVKKLIDGFSNYQDKLHEPEVFDRFQEILTKARAGKSTNKPDNELNDFEQMLEKERQQGAEDQAFEQKVKKGRAAAKKRAARKTVRKKATRAEDSD